LQHDFEKTAAAMVSGTQKAIAAAVAPLLRRIETLEARPVPEKGEKGDPGESVRGETGVGVRDAMIDRNNVLILTLSDGTTRDLGVVVGNDGLNGKDGADGPPGEPGDNGKDGFGLDDFDVNVADDGRTIIMSFDQGEQRFEAEMKFPVPIYRGVYKDGEDYEPGDLATWGGSLWHCDEKTTDKPDAGPWRLCVKKGRDGKDAK
jgi:hypothetical protein